MGTGSKWGRSKNQNRRFRTFLDMGWHCWYKALTEEGDMGYTHVYVGFRIWKALRDENKRTIDGAPTTTWGKQEMVGNGFIVGIRDFTTIPLGPVSLVLQTGLWVHEAPLSTFKKDGNEIPTTADQNIGFGFEIAPGLAFEDIGLSAVAGLRMDVQTTEITYSGILDAVAGAAYFQLFFAVSKEFAL